MSCIETKKWILLVAGSKDWHNYKHQANVCLHYQLIKRHGIPDEQIVVMMYDDIADNPENKVSKGEIVSLIDGLDVYSGVQKEYIGADVTPEKFLAVLRGDKCKAGKRVIDSGPNDNIYIYMTGLGTEDGFQFPDKSVLSPKDLIKAINDIQGKFSKMVIYMDSDYSGLMFEGLPKDVNVFALTSCHKYIENIPTNYDGERKVYLSDLFSSTWLTHLNGVNFTKDTFTELVKTKQPNYTDEACPCRFGDENITQCHLREFLQK